MKYTIRPYLRMKDSIFRVISRVIKINKNSITEVSHESIDNSIIKFRLYTPNQVTLYRANTFSSKEPETLKWIDKYGGRGVFYDIGANVGIYSIYHALKYRNEVIAFEPSLFNLQTLAKNINLNKLVDRVTIISNPVYERDLIAMYNLSNIEEGGAHSTFKENWNQYGERLEINFAYKTLGLSLNYYLEHKIIAQPSLIKIDVDGIEHLILKGADFVLKNQNLISIMIEVHAKFKEQKFSVEAQMKKYNFEFDASSSSEENQVWVRKN